MWNLFIPIKLCCFLHDTIEEVEQEDVDAADFVLTGPSNEVSVTDEEEEDNEIFNHSGVPGEVSGEIEVARRSTEPNGNDNEGKDDKESSDGDEPPRKSRIKKPKIERRKAKKEKESSEKSGSYWRCNEWESFSKTLEHASWIIW